VILIASGGEVILAVQAHEERLAEGIRSRVVSMPGASCRSLVKKQTMLCFRRALAGTIS
jgi:transketolase